MQTYPAYKDSDLDAMPFRRFMKLCPDITALFEEDDPIIAARSKVTAMRAWREARDLERSGQVRGTPQPK